MLKESGNNYNLTLLCFTVKKELEITGMSLKHHRSSKQIGMFIWLVSARMYLLSSDIRKLLKSDSLLGQKYVDTPVQMLFVYFWSGAVFNCLGQAP